MTGIVLEGQGLHSGALASVRFWCEAGPVRLRSKGVEASIDTLLVDDGSRRSTSVSSRDGRLCVGTVEHLFAALAASSVHDGLVVEVHGPEIPLLDGGAGAFLDALERLDLRRQSPRLSIVRAGSIDVGASRYEFRPPPLGLADAGVEVEVDVDFGDARLARHARWDGEPGDFRARIAPARTFGFEHEVGELLSRGLATHVDRESVVVIAREAILSAGRPFLADEPARHKLLDLIGDLYAHGGPPVGLVRAHRPGHAATHEAIRRGFDRGLLMHIVVG